MTQPLPKEDLDFILERTRDLWQEMRGQSIFMTGGTGFFGTWMAESFVHANRVEKLSAHLTILTRNPQAFSHKCPHLASDPAIELLSGDVQNFVFPEADFPCVIHLATETSGTLSSENPAGMLATILGGTERTLQFAATHGTRKFLLASSGAVYGSQPPDLSHIPEEYIGAPNSLNPQSVYGEGKRVAELLCSLYAAKYGMECKIARCFAFVGPHLPLNAHFAIGNFLRDAMRGDSIQIGGDGTPMRSYMYAADLAIWLWTILFRAPSMEAFNVGSDQTLSILELAHSVADALGSSTQIHVARQSLPGAPRAQYVPNVRKAELLLGLRCEVSLPEAVRRTAAWHQRSCPQQK